jgi:hypothetical protein
MQPGRQPATRRPQARSIAAEVVTVRFSTYIMSGAARHVGNPSIDQRINRAHRATSSPAGDQAFRSPHETNHTRPPAIHAL